MARFRMLGSARFRESKNRSTRAVISCVVIINNALGAKINLSTHTSKYFKMHYLHYLDYHHYLHYPIDCQHFYNLFNILDIVDDD